MAFPLVQMLAMASRVGGKRHSQATGPRVGAASLCGLPGFLRAVEQAWPAADDRWIREPGAGGEPLITKTLRACLTNDCGYAGMGQACRTLGGLAGRR